MTLKVGGQQRRPRSSFLYTVEVQRREDCGLATVVVDVADPAKSRPQGSKQPRPDDEATRLADRMRRELRDSVGRIPVRKVYRGAWHSQGGAHCRIEDAERGREIITGLVH